MSAVAPKHSRCPARWMASAGFALAISSALATTGAAQVSDDSWEFTRQGLLVAPFAAEPGVDAQVARRTTDRIRSRLNSMLPGREVELVRNDSVRARMIRAGFNPDSAVATLTLWQLSRNLRADEIVVGSVAAVPDGFRIVGELVLSRDLRMRQPLTPVVAASLDQAVQSMADEVVAVRSQLVHQRRCENFLREGRYADAIQAARTGVAAYANSALAQTCLTRSLLYGGYPADQVLSSAERVLHIDPGSAHALESAAMALDSLHRSQDAAAMWIRLLATDSTNQELAERVVWALHENGNSAAAEPIVIQLTELNPTLARMLHLQWRIANVNRNWPLAVASGEALMQHDIYVPADSVFISRLATVYEENGQRLEAIATAARGVAVMPEAAQLYAQYARLVQEESNVALARGLERFPRSAELLAMNAEALRAEGRLHEALAATRSAVAIDPTIPQGELSIAQAEFDLGQPDSSLASLRRIVVRVNGGIVETVADAPEAYSSSAVVAIGAERPDSGVVVPPTARGSASPTATQVTTRVLTDHERDSTLTIVGQFALSKGNQLLRAADATKRGDSFQLALDFLALADSLVPSPQSKFLVGVAALGSANAAITESSAPGVSAQRCDVLRFASPMLDLSRDSFEAGRDVAPDAVTQYMGFLGQLDSFVDNQLQTTCEGG